VNLSVAGKRVMITAAASGIGWTVAKTFLENDALVFICDISEERLEQCQAELPGIEGIPADVSDPVQVDLFFEEAISFLGGLDVLVNNAGIAGPSGPVEEMSPKEWDQTIAVNLNGQFYCLRRAVPLIKERGGGSIINISSHAGLFGYPFRTPYAASKWAIIGLTKSLAMELGEYGIRVNAICPGSVDGPRMETIIEHDAQVEGVAPEVVRDKYLRQTSLRTFINSQEVADMILYLCSDSGRSVSGQALAVDGHTETLR
jgi:NAD(P)-dependent dehydrogenase (short-subunit alcohol dehydrogenase family)